jgi:hypothetical protein
VHGFLAFVKAEFIRYPKSCTSTMDNGCPRWSDAIRFPFYPSGHKTSEANSMTENSASQDHRGTGPEWQQLEHFQSEHRKEQYLTALHSQKRSFVRLVPCSVFRVQPWEPSGFPAEKPGSFPMRRRNPANQNYLPRTCGTSSGRHPHSGIQ